MKESPPRVERVEGKAKEWPLQPVPAACIPPGKVPLAVNCADDRDDDLESAAQLALVRQIQGGDRDAVRQLYRRYAPSLYKRLMRLLGGNRDQAQDCLQQVFVKALQAIDSYRADGVLLAWLNRMTTHAVMDLFREQQGWTGILKRLKAPRVMGWGTDNSQSIPERLFLQEELKELVHQGLQTIHERKRMPILLCDLEGYSVQEAATELDIPVGTLASRLHHGRHELRAWLQGALTQRGFSAEEWLHE